MNLRTTEDYREKFFIIYMLFKHSQNMIFIKYAKPSYNSLKRFMSLIYKVVSFCASDQCFNMASYTTDIFCWLNGRVRKIKRPSFLFQWVISTSWQWQTLIPLLFGNRIYFLGDQLLSYSQPTSFRWGDSTSGSRGCDAIQIQPQSLHASLRVLVSERVRWCRPCQTLGTFAWVVRKEADTLVLELLKGLERSSGNHQEESLCWGAEPEKGKNNCQAEKYEHWWSHLSCWIQPRVVVLSLFVAKILFLTKL